MIKDILRKVIQKQDLSRSEAIAVLDCIIDQNVTDAQVAAFLTALAMKGETIDELVGFTEVMRQRMHTVSINAPVYLDTAGTGGDARGTFNISTAAAFVIAAAGLPVAKHGNRAVSSLSGSADLLSTLGVNLMLSPIAAARCLAEIGICFMFAPAFHPATKRVADIRRQLGFRTAFNLLGPLTNPAQPPCQLIGVFSEDALEKCAQTLAQLGIGCAWVVWGSDGLDEITLTGVTKVAAVVGHDITRKELQPADFGLETLALEELRGGDAAENARILREILQGERRDGLRQIVLANAAAALYLGKRAATLPQAVKLAAEAIDCGQALAKLNALIAFSQAVES